MTMPPTAFERRLLDSMAATPRRTPIVLGLDGSGRTETLLNLRRHLGATAAQYVNVERTATTPERFLNALVHESPFTKELIDGAAAAPRGACLAALEHLAHARTLDGGPATFLLDEVFELRTFENFPGLRTVLADALRVMAHSDNRFVLTTRYCRRAERAIGEVRDAFEMVAMPPLELSDIDLNGYTAALPAAGLSTELHALTGGRPGFMRAVLETMAHAEGEGRVDPSSALAQQLVPTGHLYAACRFTYELRLHRARGYGALKAILDVLAEQEPLTLTEVSHRMHRTPGSTKDYLSWLEDVDLIVSARKRYRFADPLLRLWVKLYCRSEQPGIADVLREVEAYSLRTLAVAPQVSRPEPVMPPALAAERSRPPSGIIEID